MSWYLADRLGTVRDLINNSGAIIDHVDFSAFGTVLDESNPTSGDRMMAFAGMERDTATGLNLAVFREENPGTGRWDSQDPWQFKAGDSDLYRYVRDSPTSSSDPSGRGPLWLNWWTIPQSWVSLQDSRGGMWIWIAAPNVGGSLRKALQKLKDHGLKVKNLFIKGHGGDELIQLTDDVKNPDALAVLQGRVLINGEDVTELLKEVTDRQTTIELTGCHTRELAQNLSTVLGDGVGVWGAAWRWILGIPLTPYTVGSSVLYRNGVLSHDPK